MSFNRLNDVAEILSGFAFKSSNFSDSAGIPVIRISNINNDAQVENNIKGQKYYPFDIEEKLVRFLVKKGDILIALSGATTGKIGIYSSDKKALLNQRVALVRAKTCEDHRYLYYALLAKSRQILNDAYGGAQPNISPNKIGEYEFYFPPELKDRIRIADAIETQFTRLDAAIKSLKTIQAKLEIYRQSVLKAAFENRYQESGAGMVKMSDVCEKVQDGSHFSPKKQYAEKAPGKYLYVTAKNIRSWGVDINNVTYVDRGFFEEIYKRCDPRKGDLLLTKDGVNTGDSAINTLDEPFALLSSVALLRGKGELLSNKFLKLYLDSPYGKKSITGSMTGTAIKRIILKRLKDAVIPVIPLTEQKQLVAEIESRFSVIDKVEETVNNTLLKAERLRKSILKAAFEGELID